MHEWFSPLLKCTARKPQLESKRQSDFLARYTKHSQSYDVRSPSTLASVTDFYIWTAVVPGKSSVVFTLRAFWLSLIAVWSAIATRNLISILETFTRSKCFRVPAGRGFLAAPRFGSCLSEGKFYFCTCLGSSLKHLPRLQYRMGIVLPIQKKEWAKALVAMWPYPPETVLFTALPMLCISSPMPRIVAHPSEAKKTKSNDQRSNLFFFIFYLPCDMTQQPCQT